MSPRPPPRPFFPAAALVLASLLGAVPAAATTFRVDRTDDEPTANACADATPNDCSLRGAVANANAATEPSTIELPAGTYPISASVPCTFRSIAFPFPSTASMTALCLTKATTIRGAGAELTKLDGQMATRMLYVSLDGEVEVSGVAFEHGAPADFTPHGGAIWNDGELTLRESVLRANKSITEGGALFSGGTLHVYGSTFEGNLGRNGGAAWLRGPTTIEDSRFTGNSADAGGAIGVQRPTNDNIPLAITGSLVDGSESGLGAIWLFGVDALITNTTISGNGGVGPALHGAGLRADVGTLDLRNVTITDNIGNVGGGLSVLSAAVRMRNTLIAGNHAATTGATDCLGPVVSEGYNLVEDVTGCSITGDTTGNVIGQDALLGPLTANGGPTLTHSPAAGSPALEAGHPGLPGSGGGACAAVDQRGLLRPEGERCDIGALEKPPGLTFAGVEPAVGGNAGSVLVRAFGSGFEPGATLRLVRAGEADVVADPVEVDFGGSALAARFDLAGSAPGAWDVAVQNPGGDPIMLPAAFTVAAGGGPDLWIEVTGRLFLRTLRATTLVVQVGNRGSVDALGVPITLSFPEDVHVGVHGTILDPPLQPGQVFTDWTVVPNSLAIASAPGVHHVPLLLPSIPAGTTRSLRLSVTMQGTEERILLASFGTPYFQPGVDPASIARHVAAALAIIERTGGLPIPAVVRPQVELDLAAYLTVQREAILAAALANLAEGLGVAPRFYSESQLELDAAYFAAQRTGELLLEQLSAGTAAAPEVREALQMASSALERVLAALAPARADAAITGQKCPPKGSVGVLKPGENSGPGCTGNAGPDDIGPSGAPPPPTCFGPVAKILGVSSDGGTIQEGIRELKECGPGIDECQSLPEHTVALLGGQPFCVPKFPQTCKIKCQPFPLKPIVSIDPNEKVGALGAGEAHFVADRAPFTYTVFFENLETATAAAQEVVVTDQLDTEQLDLSTFALGPITFADFTLTPAPDVQAWSGGVDLRPAKNLIVGVDAALDEETGVVTWRFRSLDPDTLELTDDPVAGFLAPNVNPPEGDGSVSFTIAPKAGFADGATVCNDASIVFDLNAPIETEPFCNTLDEAPPASSVGPLPLLSPAAPFQVVWSSSDAGAGVAGTTLFVSENGGPYELFVEAGPEQASAEFTPEAGTLYRFYSVAVDAAGNEEAAPAEADAETTTAGGGDHDLAVLSVKAPKRTALAASPTAKAARIKVSLQNAGPHAETVATLDALRALVTLEVDSRGACADLEPTLQEAKLAKKLPLTWAPRKKLSLTYDVRFDCANEPAAGTPDFDVRARVNHLALGSPDAQPANDTCPRVTPDGSKSCAAPIVVDVEAR